MIDVHAHFAGEGYSFPEEWDKIQSAGVSRVILAGDNLGHSTRHRDFCKTHEGAFFCAGVHPTEKIEPFSREEEESLFSLLTDEKCVAVGEIGLDYHYPDTDKTLQRKLLLTQLDIAEKAGLPVEIHSRDACEDTLALLRERKDRLKGILLHCYSYGRENLQPFLFLGAYFSFGGVVCFKNSRRVAESVVACPADRILTETDSPYLSPFRGEKNTPANIPVILNKIAQLRNTDVSELEKQIERNAFALFGKMK